MTDKAAITCVGTLSQITCYNVRALTLDGYGERVEICTILGNDAVIVARLLAASETSATCLLVRPTESDLRILRAVAPTLHVEASGARSGAVTCSAVLQAINGDRYWLLPPTSPVTFPLPEPELVAGQMLYADLYDELEEPMIAWLSNIRPSGLMVNLSATRHIAKATRLAPLRPILIQASLPEPAAVSTLQETAHELRSAACSEYVLVSAGPRGFALAGPRNQTWTRIPPHLTKGGALGAGAAVSAGLLHALIRGESGGRLADSAAAWVASYLTGAVP